MSDEPRMDDAIPERILEIARGSVMSREQWFSVECDIPTKNPDGSWRVVVRRVPASKREVRHMRIYSDATKLSITDYGDGP